MKLAQFAQLTRHALYAIFLSYGIDFTQHAWAQVNTSQSIGYAPLSSYDNDKWLSVNLLTGIASGSIPLVSYPQLGDLKSLDYSLTYSSGSWGELDEYCGDGSLCSVSYYPTGGIGVWPVTNYTYGWELNLEPDVNGNFYYYDYSVSDYTLATHPMIVDANNWDRVRSYDHSGLSLALSSKILTLPNGVSLDSDSVRDLNGNQMNVTASGGIQDSVGRNIPAFINGATIGNLDDWVPTVGFLAACGESLASPSAFSCCFHSDPR